MRFLLLLLTFVGLNASVSVDRMIGQMLIVGFSGQNVEDKSVKQISRDISYGRVSGVLLLERNIKNPKQLKSLTKRLSKIQISQPLFIAIDQEGGNVARLNANNGFKYFPSASKIGDTKTLTQASQIYRDLAFLLKEYNINFNLAPVLDLGFTNSYMQKRKRTFSTNEDIVSIYANVFIDELSKANIITSLKHFPGLGSTKDDTHKKRTDVTNSWQIKELKPYYNMIKTDRAKSIIVGHFYLKQFDEKYPASLSKAIIQKLLREKMGFDGVVISDDLLMDALEGFELEERVILAINAGVDLFLIGDYFVKNSNYVKIITDIIKKAINENKITPKRLKESYKRITELKKEL